MNIFSRLFKQNRDSSFALGGTPQTGRVLKPPKNADEMSRHYQGWVFSASSTIAEEVAQIKFNVANRQGDVLNKHKVLDFLEYPSPEWPAGDLIQFASIDLDLTGEAFWQIIVNQSNRPIELFPINPSAVTVELGESGLPTNYKCRISNSDNRTIPRELMIHFRRPNPVNKLRGKSIVEAGYDGVAIENVSADSSYSAIKNYESPPGVFKTDRTVSQAGKDSIRESWRRIVSGPGNRGKIAVLERGMDYQKISTDLEKFQMTATRKMNRDYILGMFKTSASVLGIEENSNRASAETDDYRFSVRAIRSRMNIITQALNFRLMPLIDKTKTYKLGFENPVPRDKEFDLKERVETTKMPFRTINEVRADLGLPAIQGGDKIYQALNNVPLGSNIQVGKAETKK